MQSATFRLSPEDYVAYNQRMCAHRLVRVLAIAVLILAVIAIVDDGMRGIQNILIGALAGLVALVAYIFVLIPRQARGIYAEQPSMSEPRTLTINAKGIEFNQPSGTFRTEWKDVVQWDETSRLLILFINRALFIPITKADIGNDVTDGIRILLARSGLATPRRKRARA